MATGPLRIGGFQAVVFLRLIKRRQAGVVPEIARFFGIIVQMFFDDHNPPHLHAEYQGKKVLVDFQGNVLRGDLGSRTALRLLREWIDLHPEELALDWELARAGREIRKIPPLE